MLLHEQRLVEALRSHAPTIAIITSEARRIAINAAAQGTPAPYIVITTSLTPDVGLAGNILAWGLQAGVQCWGVTATQASLLADQAQAALILARYAPPSRVAGYDDERGLDAVILTIEDWLSPDEVEAQPVPEFVAGLAIEIDIALALSAASALAAGLAFETDTALLRSFASVIAAGLALEADTALARTFASSIAAGLAVETDLALGQAGFSARAAGLAVETDSAFARAVVSAFSAGLASETDIALSRTVASVIAVGFAGELDTALARSFVTARAAGLAVEADSALARTFVAVIATGLAVEADSAFASAVASALATGSAIEFDTAIARTFGSAPFRYWRLDIAANDGNGTYTSMSRMKLLSGATELLFAHIVSASQCSESSANGGSETASQLADNDPASEWVTAAGQSVPSWVEFDLLVPYSIDRYAIISQRIVTGRTPTTWVLRGRNSTVESWTDVDARSGQTGWALLEERTFAL